MFRWVAFAIAVLKLGQYAMPETCENLRGLVKSCVYYDRQSSEIYQVLPYSMDFKAPVELLNPPSKTVPSKCSFVWTKEPVNIRNDRKAER